MPPSPPPSDGDVASPTQDNSSSFSSSSPELVTSSLPPKKQPPPQPIKRASTMQQQQQPRSRPSLASTGTTSSRRSRESQQAYAATLEEEHRFGGTHWLPMIFAVVPGLGAVFYGEAESWTDGLIIFVCGLFLWQMTKIPWQMYTSARVARLVSAPRPDVRSAHPYAAEVERYEVLALLLTLATPLAGLLLLSFAYAHLSSTSQPALVNRTSLILYALGASVRPLSHLVDLTLARVHHLQSLARPPPAPAIVHLRSEVAQLRSDLVNLRSIGATQSDVRHLRDTLDAPLGQLSRAIRRSVREEEGIRLGSEQRFDLLERAVDELGRRLERDERAVRRLESENDELRTTPIAAVGALFAHLVGLSSLTSSRSRSPPPSSSSNANNNAASSSSSGERGRLLNRRWSDPPASSAATRAWTDRAPFVLFLLPINVAALAVAYLGTVVAGSSATSQHPHYKRVEGGPSSSSTTTFSNGSPVRSRSPESVSSPPPSSSTGAARRRASFKGKQRAEEQLSDVEEELGLD